MEHLKLFMNLNKLLILFRSLESREQTLLKIIFMLVPLLFFGTYYLQLSESTKNNTRNASLAKSNFEYVQNKALNFQAYAESQEALLRFPEPNSFMINESQKFKFTDFRVTEESGDNIFYLTSASVASISKFVETISSHPAISIVSISLAPSDNSYSVKVVFLK
tara:strand:- start:133 stop:624 length:492 start_codon:yes stop_codon:yes gene_type:complete